MTNYEKQYICNLNLIYQYGAEEENKRTGIKTKRIPNTQIIVDLQKEFPILQSKKVSWRVAADEILWIMQKQSNRTSELNSHIWDNWTGKDGTIGKSYGYQVRQPIKRNSVVYDNQVQYVLETLKKDPSNRQCVIDMWNVSELGEMNLVPCCYSSVWNIIDGKLNCMLVQRSADYPVGVPFDTTEYAILVHMFARHLGVKPGKLTHVMADSHIYENQYDGVERQFAQYYELKSKHYENPKFVFRDNAPTNFWLMDIDDINIINYEHMDPIKYEVAV